VSAELARVLLCRSSVAGRAERCCVPRLREAEPLDHRRRGRARRRGDRRRRRRGVNQAREEAGTGRRGLGVRLCTGRREDNLGHPVRRRRRPLLVAGRVEGGGVDRRQRDGRACSELPERRPGAPVACELAADLLQLMERAAEGALLHRGKGLAVRPGRHRLAPVAAPARAGLVGDRGDVGLWRTQSGSAG